MQTHLNCKWSRETVDTFKSGNPDNVVTGVAVSMFADMTTLRKAVANNCNLIIVHEPTFYNLKGSQLRIVGDPQMRFTNVALAVGAPGSQSHRALLNDKSTELLVAGEAQEWETYEYVLDASMLGMKKAAIFTGHIPSEEAGMEYCANWLKTFIKDIPVIYLENGSAYWSVQNVQKP
ncbi:MAG: Nif3-like dinuclear metal center hexameric protein [Bacteroidota bacterium]|nr:Nif3-like dinuclear metal center hexameric protein [Bacteroidota bacterium]